MRIYPTVTEHINMRPYKLEVPAYYCRVPALVENGEIAPIFFGGAHDMTTARLPICNMIDMYITKVQFAFTEERDVMDVLLHMDAYLKEVYDAPSNSPEIQAYAKKMLAFRKQVSHMFKKLLNKHPDWKIIYNGESSGILKLMAELRSMIGEFDFTQELERRISSEVETAPTRLLKLGEAVPYGGV